MERPLQISFDNVEHSDAVEARIRDEVTKLEQVYDRITSMRVVVTKPQKRHHKGDTFQVRIHITVPGGTDIAITRDPAADGAHEDVYVTVRDAFNSARRKLQDTQRKRQA